MRETCALCGGYYEASIHREPYGRAMAYVMYTHQFEASVNSRSDDGA